MDVLENVGRASIKSTEGHPGDVLEQGRPPKDTFWYIRIVVLIMGLTTVLAIPFIMTANDYWMYKFRDPAFDTWNARNKTTLETNFTASLGVALCIPALVGLLIAVTVGHKIEASTRIIFACALLTICFALFTMFVEINTDSWQMGFFIVTMIKIGTMAIIFVTLSSSLIVLIPALPPTYMKIFMFGQGSAGIFSAILQIISLAIGNSSTAVALIYFGSGAALYFITLLLFVSMKYSPFFRYYKAAQHEDTSRPRPKVREIINVVKNMWPVMFVVASGIASSAITHPNITILIASENYGDGTAWTKIYFVPVITFLVADIANVAGRAVAKNFLTSKNKYWFVAASVARMIIFPFLFINCNVRTKNSTHDPLFPHDWEYILILIIFVAFEGFLQTSAVLSIPNFVKGAEKIDLYYLMFQVVIVLAGLACSPLGIIVVNML